MPILDFKEISEAHIADGMQDTFELFARDFMEMIGLRVISGPDRGQDGGRDLLAVETRGGIIGTTEVKWLISCKHKAHSGESVKNADETDILDRVRAHDAKGFIGFYSTIISSPLGRKLDGLRDQIEIKVFDREMIENELLDSTTGKRIASRYFPVSYNHFSTSSYSPSNILTAYHPLACKYCGKDLLQRDVVEDYQGIVVFVSDRKFMHDNNYNKELIIDLYWSCKGKCDRILENSYRARGGSTAWEDISDIIIPTKYLSWNMAILNGIRDGRFTYSNEAYSNLKEFIIRVSQYTLREQTETQISRYNDLLEIPDWF